MHPSKRPLAGNPSTLADCPKTSRDLSSAHGFFRRRTPVARVECPFPTGSARLRKLLKKTSMPRSSPPLGPEAPERTGVLKRDVAEQEGPHSDNSGGVVRMPGTPTRSLDQQVRDGLAHDRSRQSQNPPLEKSSAIPALPWPSKPRLRYSPGLAPTTRLNALLNAASDS